MDYNTLRDAFDHADSTMSLADRCAGRAVRYAAGRLRRLDLSRDTLRALKRELDGYNSKRGKWKTPSL